jgi:stage III sporulation protein AE
VRFWLLYLLVLLVLVPLPAWGETPVLLFVPDEQLGALDLVDIEKSVEEMEAAAGLTLDQGNFGEMAAKLARGEISWQPGEIFRSLMMLVFKEVLANIGLLGKLVVIAVIGGVLQKLVAAFERGSTGQLAYTVTYLALLSIAIGSFTLAVKISQETVDYMVLFMQALLPILLTMLAAIGGFTSTALFSPVLLGTLGLFGAMVKNIILPLLLFAAVLGIVNNLTDSFKVSGLANLLKGAAMGLMGLFTTIFLGVITLQGIAGAVGDSVTFKTAKFGVDAFVPVVGGVFSDALAAVVSSSLLIKNAIGIAGIVTLGAILLIPLLKIVTLALIYKFASALIQPIGEGRMSECLNGLGNSLLLIFAAVATVGLLFFFLITIVVAVANITVMLR